jgi:hypothetical protein
MGGEMYETYEMYEQGNGTLHVRELMGHLV